MLNKNQSLEGQQINVLQNLLEHKNVKKDLSKKAAWITAGYVISFSSEFLQVYLLSKKGLSSFASSMLINAFDKFVINPPVTIINQNAVIISGKFAELKELQGSNSYGNEDIALEIEHKLGDLLRQGWILSIMTSIPVMALCFSSKSILESLGVSNELSQLTSEYFFPVAFSIPFSYAGTVNQRLFSSVNQEKFLPLYNLVLSTMKIGLSIWLIEEYKTFGAGLAVAIQGVFDFSLSSLIIMLNKSLRHYQPFHCCKQSFDALLPMFKQGLPIMLSALILGGSNFTLSMLINKLGTDILSVEHLLGQLYGVATTLTVGIQQASNRLIAQYLAQKQCQDLKACGNYAMFGAGSIFIIFTILYNIFPDTFSSILVSNDFISENKDLIQYGFIMIGIAKFLEVIQSSATLNLAGMQDTFFSFTSQAVSILAIIMPLAFITSSMTDMGIYGLMTSMIIGLLVSSVATTGQWIKQSKKAVRKNDFSQEKDSSNAKFGTLIKNCTFFICRKENDFLINEEEAVFETPLTENMSYTN